MIPFSVLDLSPITEGSTATQSFKNTLSLAKRVDDLGYKRYWLAEHHGMPGIASAATSLLISHVAAGTKNMRVGAGGIMLPNHSPLVIAEQFGTLECLYPGRIDLGLGRAPGSDTPTSRALRRNLTGSAHDFPQDVIELMDYMSDDPKQSVEAVPGKGAKVPIWILGSSLFGAQLAAALGLPYAFASHFAPQQMEQAVDLYRKTFQPSDQLQEPHVMLAYNVFAADTNEEAEILATSAQQYFVQLRTSNPGKVPPPVPGYLDQAGEHAKAIISHVMRCSAIGDKQTVAQNISSFIERMKPEELIIVSNIFDIDARIRSYEITAEIFQQLR